ncbi:uncharacterized protein LOC116200082 [Punica granatum]|uniref:Uncharacterized protein LOC116200082 n=2 Tax=Punica granatum TaxID=22663 RepID=A0A6P8CX95_PUNGR|nr:uncharacterized protein LOC116200082 [Punica granatum]PKI72664.1 hypothetical protein CRG98_007041 [Punica granatum]
MLPLKLVRSLVLKESLHAPLPHDPSHSSDDDSDGAAATSGTPILVFLPTRELVTDTYRLATIARDMGMDLHPTPSLSHIIFTYPSSPSSPSPSSSSSSASPLSSFPSSSSSLLLLSDAVPLPFPSLSPASISALRHFASLSRGLFKLVLVKHFRDFGELDGSAFRNWNCCSVSLFSRLSRERIGTMDGFSRALAGNGWTLFKTWKDPSVGPADPGHARGGNAVYLFRKVDSNRVRVRRDNGECRIRELRLPALDFRNAPLRILQYVVLMTDDVFYLA